MLHAIAPLEAAVDTPCAEETTSTVVESSPIPIIAERFATAEENREKLSNVTIEGTEA